MPVAAVLAVFLLLPASLRGQEEAVAPSPDQAKALFEWFDGLGFPSVKGKPFVRFTGFGWGGSGNGPPEAMVEYGFLLEDRGTSFRILTPSLSQGDLRKTDGSVPAWKRAEHFPADFEKALRPEVETGSSDLVKRVWYESRLEPETQEFVLAKFAADRGLTDFSRALLQKSFREKAGRGTAAVQDYRKFLENDLVDLLLTQAMCAFEDATLSRRDLLERFRTVARAGPGSKAGEEGRRVAGLLERMIVEDESHRVPAGFPDSCSTEDAAREWTWRLRDQYGLDLFWIVRGPDRVPPDDESVSEPAHRLFALGLDAVPALLEAFDDPRPSRSVYRQQRHGDLVRVNPVGAVAQALLEALAGREFSGRKPAEQWWKEVKRRGWVEVLSEAVRKGDRESEAQAEWLAKKFPKEAPAAITEGLTHATEYFIREKFIRLLGGLEAVESLAPFTEELKAGPFLTPRIEAARVLHRKGVPDGVRAMLAEWQHATNEYGLRELIRFLAECGDLECLRALGSDLGQRPVGWRFDVLRAVHERATEKGKPGGPSKEWAAVAERMLVDRLGDRDACLGLSGFVGELPFQDPRICDMAASWLVGMRPEFGSFNASASPSAKDRACVRIANVWRKEQGLELLADPVRGLVPAPPDGTAALVRALREDPAAESPLRAVGLPALALVREELAGLPSEHPARPRFEALAKDLAFTVREGSAFKGRQLRGGDLVDALIAALKELPPARDGIDLLLERPEDGTGVVIQWDPADSSPGGTEQPPGGWPRESSPGGWTYSISAVRSGRTVTSEHGSCTESCLLETRGWDSLLKAMETLLQASPEEPVEVRIRVRRG